MIPNIKIYKNIWIIFVKKNYIWLLILIKLSSYFKQTNVVDIISYQHNYNSTNNVYYILYNHTYNLYYNLFIYNLYNKTKYLSTEFIYYNCAWFEREISELFNIKFKNKKDTRNLLLPYLDTTYPLKKNYPVMGYYNIIYNIIFETLFYTNLYIQL